MVRFFCDAGRRSREAARRRRKSDRERDLKLESLEPRLALAVMTGLPDTIAPVVRSVVLPAAGTYGTDRALTFKVNFSEPVQGVKGDQSTVTLPVEIGSAMREAQYVSGSGTKSLTFRLTVKANDVDTDAVTMRKGAAVASPAFRGANGLVGGVILLKAAADLKDSFGNRVTAIGGDFGTTSTAAGSRVVVIETLSEQVKNRS